MQNRVCSDRESALSCPSGSLDIVTENGFTYNANFNPEFMTYDQDYDNNVPSQTFMRYYDEIVDYLVSRYDLRNGIILDIGCGKGTFLSRMADRYKYIKGMGIDPAYEGPVDSHGGRLKFINEYFQAGHIENVPSISLILLRHTLEHISSPTEFLKNIFSIVKKPVPVFIEVPDLNWIFENRAFWDFCYEHVNYFTMTSLAQCINDAGGQVRGMTSAFEGQYIWTECILNSDANFANYLKDIIDKFKSLNKKIVIWGMATKGVMYVLYLLNNNIRIDYCVDINIHKQGKYAPLSGYKILPPESLRPDEDYAIICMNPNYAREIYDSCKILNLKFELFSPFLTSIKFKEKQNA